MEHKIHFDTAVINSGMFEYPASSPTRLSAQSSDFKIHIDTSLIVSVHSQSIRGNIVIQTLKTIDNRDFRVQLIGSCIRYSNNPLQTLQDTDRSITREQSLSQIVSEILLQGGKKQNYTAFNEQVFLQGSQLLRYIEENENIQQLEVLQPNVYNIPFQFSLPKGSPPSIGMLGFVNIYFTVQYKIVIEQILSQTIVLQIQPRTQIQQFCCTTLQFQLHKFCFICLGSYKMQAIVRVAYDIVHVKLQFYRKGQKYQNRPLIKDVNVALVVQIVDVGKRKITQQKVVLQELQYGILGVQFKLCNLTKVNMKSYNNQVNPTTASNISIHSLRQQKLYIEL